MYLITFNIFYIHYIFINIMYLNYILYGFTYYIDLPSFPRKQESSFIKINMILRFERKIG